MEKLQGIASPSEDLVHACREGDEAAWALLIRNYQRLIYSVARAVCPRPDDAADVFQQVCLELYKRIREIRDAAALPKWLATVTRRTAISMLRKRSHLADLDEIEIPVDSRVEAVLRRDAIERALERLPEKGRELLTLLYFSEEPSSYAEVSRRLGIPVSSIGPTRARCLQKLRNILERP